MISQASPTLSSEKLPTLDSLTLLTTFKCNFTCKHCGYRSNPQRKEVMPLDAAKSLIDQAATYSSLEVISFTGGEPFLYPKMLRKLILYCEKHGLSTAVVTNCFWANSEERATETLKDLNAHGLVDLTTSYDWFHEEFISIDPIRHGVRAALRLGMTVHLNICVSRNGSLTKTDIVKQLDLTDKEFRGNGRIEVKELSPIRVGYAEDFLSDSDFIRYDESWLFNRECRYAISNPVVTPEGDFYGCCGFGGGTDKGPSRLLHIGNLDESSFDELWKRLQHNLMFNIIARKGPGQLIQIVKDRWPTTETRGEYVFNCEVCQEITRRSDLQEKITKTLNELTTGTKEQLRKPTHKRLTI